MLEGLYKLLNISHDMWDEITDDYKLIVSMDILAELFKKLPSQQQASLVSTLNASKDYAGDLLKWTEENKLPEDMSKMLKVKMVDTTVDFMNALLGNSEAELRQKAGDYISNFVGSINE